ncbi:MAG: RsmG family class I SAM-dependent methyltransferase [Actinomycetota bacterium]
MKHGTDSFEMIEGWLGIGLDAGQRAAIIRFERWLDEEAIPAGGIGPAESDRLFDRHIVDSLAFQLGIPGDARTAVDVGGGVGLPSIPLAIARPDIEFTLVERSRRRTDLATRAARILGLSNYSVLTKDVSAIDVHFDVALFRASLPIVQAANALTLCLDPAGTGLLAVSRQAQRPSLPSAPESITFALSREGDGILASPFWLLKMRYC